MLLAVLALLHAAAGFNVDVEGDVAIDMRLSNTNEGKQKRFRQASRDVAPARVELVLKMLDLHRSMTVAPEVECAYEYPEKQQLDAILSNMMNELTKIFVRANEFITDMDSRRMAQRTKKPSIEDTTKGLRRGDENRFKVVERKQKVFFEHIYTNMTDEYRQFYNTTVERVDRSGRDPCLHQDEVKLIWRDLLEHSLVTLKKAAYRCVDEYLRDQKIEPDSRVAKALGQFLMRELSKMRSNQLSMLCDIYQMCYDELLQ